MATKGTNRPLITLCCELADCHKAGVLLYRILFWYGKAKVMHKDGKWIVNERPWWCHQTGLSLNQYKSALAKLKKAELIEVVYRHFYGIRTTHIRPVKGIAGLLERHDKDLETFVGSDGTHSPWDGTNAQPPLKQGASTRSFNMEIAQEAQQGGCTVKDGGGKGVEVNESKMGKKVKAVTDVMKQRKRQKPKSYKPQDIYHVWKDTLNEVYGVFVVAWGGKEFGQTKVALTKVPGNLYASALEHAVRNWIECVNYLEENTTGFDLPAKPDYNTVIRFTQGVVDFYEAKDKPVKLMSTDDEKHEGQTLAEVIANLEDGKK